ncbi:hypothetical protein GCM10027434_08340 [Hymenobacter luteus]
MPAYPLKSAKPLRAGGRNVKWSDGLRPLAGPARYVATIHGNIVICRSAFAAYPSHFSIPSYDSALQLSAVD